MRHTVAFFPALLVTALMLAATGLAQEDSQSEAAVAEWAKRAWESGAIGGTIDSLDEWIQDHPHSPELDKLHGDILATSRRLPESAEAYDTVLARKPAALDVRWAKWSVLLRAGRREEAVTELQRLAQADAGNPLIHLRLAQELRKLDRLEDSLAPYQQAVDLAPELLSWRLGLARARFDVLDYPRAYAEVELVLDKVPPGSPLEIPARNLLAVIIGTASATERGRRANPIAASEETQKQRGEWALMRGDAWRLFEAGRYKEAEPLYRKLLALNPGDPTAAHQLGLILMEQGRCKEAVPYFQAASNLDPGDEEYADSLFRMGQCLAALEQWQEALMYFDMLYQGAIEYEKSAKAGELPPGTRVLDKQKLAKWIERVQPHVPPSERLSVADPSAAPDFSMEALMAKMAAEPLKPHKPLDTRVSLAGRDADFSWFRFVIPATRVMRDDSPTGEHEFIPLSPGDTFPATQKEIYLVFALVTASYDEVPLTAQCFLETAELSGQPSALAQDKIVMAMSDQSGYFKLTPPSTGWMPGLYRCGLFEGQRTSAYSQVDEVRFRIVAPGRSS